MAAAVALVIVVVMELRLQWRKLVDVSVSVAYSPKTMCSSQLCLSDFEEILEGVVAGGMTFQKD
jgi:hypothetical protein